MSTPQAVEPSMSLYALESAIVELFALRDEAEAEGDAQQVALMDQEIAKWTAAELRKVDGVAAWIRECEARAQIADEEAERLRHRAKAWQAKADRVKEAAKQAMLDHDLKKVAGRLNTLRIQGNGGLQKLETDMATLPDSFRLFRIDLSSGMYQRFLDCLPSTWAGALKERTTSAPDLNAIRDALKMQIVCPECKGNMVRVRPEPGPEFEKCPRCNGAGTIQNTVPGAKLLERGVLLRID